MLKEYKNLFIAFLLIASFAMGMGCKKTDYNDIPNPAYLRVFNSLNYTVDITNKGFPIPFLTMVIDPVFGSDGLVTGGKIIGDFLDKRAPYAPPYPANAGSTGFNTEYPGTEKVLTGPILNGIDLSSWAQIPSGKHRIVFYLRPYNGTPFFSLADRDRKWLIIDSTVDLSEKQVYTMEILQKDILSNTTLNTQLYIRKENFTTAAFSDSLLYVNFYNLSAQGYAAANPSITANILQLANASNDRGGYSDTMNIYYTLYRTDTKYPWVAGAKPKTDIIPGYSNLFLTTLIRSQAPDQAPYLNMPMFAAGDTTGGILSMQWELFRMYRPGELFASNIGVGCSNIGNDGKGSAFSVPLDNAGKALATSWLPNMIKYTPSGNYLQRSFATISTIEIINGQTYMISVQRNYPPPTR